MSKKRTRRVPRDLYEAELARLQVELARMQTWVRAEGARVVVLFEGRDAAGKGGTIKRITEPLNPRFCRIAALPAPTERESTEWYFQRYVAHLPSAGEIVLFDRSWYNRAGVEHVLGFCTDDQYRLFMRQCPEFERMLIDDGILLTKYWFSVSDEQQRLRFQERIDDPTKRWKLSPMDLESRSHYVDYSRAKDEMFVYTDLPESPWFVVEADDKRRARLNCIAHLLSRDPLRGSHRQASAEASAPAVGGRLPPPSGRLADVRPRSCRSVSRAELILRLGAGQPHRVDACPPVLVAVDGLARPGRDVLVGQPDTVCGRVEHRPGVVAPPRRLPEVGPSAAAGDDRRPEVGLT